MVPCEATIKNCLSSKIDDSLQKGKDQVCHKYGIDFQIQFSINGMFCLDVENIEKDTKICKINLNELETELVLNGQDFFLAGVVGFEEPFKKSFQESENVNDVYRHYSAYTRGFNGIWFHYDSNGFSPSKPQNLGHNFIINLALLLYVEYGKDEK